MHSSDIFRGPVQEFDFGSDEDEPEPAPLLRGRKSKQSGPAPKIVPTGSDDSSESDSEDDEEDRITIANMAARSRALDEKAAADAELDIAEQQAAAASDDEDEDIDMEEDVNGDIEGVPFRLPTAAEREEEKITVPDVHTVQRRMRECVRILGKFKRLAEKGRWVFFPSPSGSVLIICSSGLGLSTSNSSWLISAATMVTTSFSPKSSSICFLYQRLVQY
jgi:ribosomal RNA methyltransferase Nop2